jgi:hypothetical protein
MKTILIALLLLITLPCHAALVDNGNGLIYDTDLDITWLDRPNNTLLYWPQAVAWAESLTDGGVGGWRLPKTIDGSPRSGRYSGVDGSGFNNVTGEMAHLYYVELGNKGMYDTMGRFQPDHGLLNEGPFTGIETDNVGYWSTDNALDDDYGLVGDFAWCFDFHAGLVYSGQERGYWTYALAVHDGNIFVPDTPDINGGTSVPEPSTLWLLLLGACPVLWRRRPVAVLCAVLLPAFLMGCASTEKTAALRYLSYRGYAEIGMRCGVIGTWAVVNTQVANVRRDCTLTNVETLFDRSVDEGQKCVERYLADLPNKGR